LESERGFLKSLKGFWGAVCAEIGKYWAEETVKPLFWVESTFDFASDAEKNAVISHPSTRGQSPFINTGTVPVEPRDCPLCVNKTSSGSVPGKNAGTVPGRFKKKGGGE
jgi:hypothetical protein